MPLHCEHEALPGQLQCLDHTIGIPAADDQAVAQLGDGLVVITPRVDGFADQRGQPGAGHCAHRQRVEYRVAGPVSAVADDVGQVLVQRSAERDVEHLCAAADAQHRKLPLERGAQQPELPVVALPLRAGRCSDAAVDRRRPGSTSLPPVISSPSRPSRTRSAISESTGCGGSSTATPPAAVTP